MQVLLLTNRKNIYTFKENNTPTSPKNHKKLPWYKVYLRQDCRILLMAVLVTFLLSMGACLLDWKWYLKMYPHLITIYIYVTQLQANSLLNHFFDTVQKGGGKYTYFFFIFDHSHPVCFYVPSSTKNYIYT